MRNDLAKFVRVRVTREPVNAVENIEAFPATEAKYIRFSIDATNASEPCIDELQVFAGERNVGLASTGAVATSSGDFEHHCITRTSQRWSIRQPAQLDC